MKLYFVDNERINKFNLPETIEESFLFSYTPSLTNIEVFINIYAKDGNWYIKNNEDISFNDSNEDIILEEFNNYEVTIKGINEKFYLYTYPNYNNQYIDISIENINQILIGKANNNDIIYNGNLITDQQNIITIENGLHYIDNINKETNFKTYINDILLTKKQFLNIGDTIYIDNLKLVWMKNFIRIFNTNKELTLSSNVTKKEIKEVNNKNYLNYDIKENDISIYSEEDYFFHKPRLVLGAPSEEVTIDSPPNKELKDDVPLIFQLGTGLTMLVFSISRFYTSISSLIDGTKKFGDVAFNIISSLIMIICSFLLPKLLKRYNKKRAIEKEKIRQEKYTAYLDEKQKEINKILKFQSQTLYDNNLSSKECYEVVIGNKTKLWQKEIRDDDFLSIRVGIGNIPANLKINAAQKQFTIEEDNLFERIYSITNSSKELIQVPMSISLSENYISSIICNTEYSKDFINGILLQLLTMHNPKDLKIIFLTSEKNAYKWEYLKLMPHLQSDDKKVRYFATNEEECKNILKEVDSLYNERKEEISNKDKDKEDSEIETKKETLYKNYSPYYLIITDNYKKYQNLDFLNKIINFQKNVGFSLLMIDSSMRNLPNNSNKFTYVTNSTSCIFEKDYNKNNQLNFTPEFFLNLDMYRVARELSNIPVQTVSDVYNLPNNISFLEMYNVGNIEQLNILNKWSTNDPITSLQCPIGVQPSGESFKLDLHEKAHGPHGLIAGSTGSGKSEFIITYVLSMAVNYHPDEVQFVLIDYKGGGLAGAFENRELGIKIPHLAGTITNLDTSEMHRTLVSIESELKRRQMKFNEAKDILGESTIDIYKYQKYYREGILKEPMPHLFIISDEFAELKSQQPEFMDELISTSRIGRSLGIHLILATQKPSGVVNEQIWSNSRFKVCLKVQTKGDSNEMLKRPDAASIKETGRFYLQVGYDELFELGQSAYAGTQYIPTEKVVKKVDDSIIFINNVGEIIKSVNDINIQDKNDKEKNGDQLTNIVKYLNNIGIKNNVQTKPLWLPNIPSEILLTNLEKKYNYTTKPFEINPIIGEYDDPTIQKQGLLTVNFKEKGNLLIYGMQGSGKENLITTLITSTCTKHNTDEINFYLVDFGAETLKKFEKFPQVGDIVLSDEGEKLGNLYLKLYKEIEYRKELFSEYMGNYETYIKESGKTVPNIICTILGYENFTEMYPLLAEKFALLYKDGPKFGVYFIIANSLTTGIRSKIMQSFTNKIALKISDPKEYKYLLGASKNTRPSNYFGRGIAIVNNSVEFQTAYITKPDDINKTIKLLGTQLSETLKNTAPKIDIMPKYLTVNKLINEEKFDLTNVPVGIAKSNLKIIKYDFNKFNFTPIITNSVNKNIHFIYGLIDLLKQLPNIKLRIIDAMKIYNNTQGVPLYNKDLDTVVKQIKLEILDDDKKEKKNIFLIIGLSALKNIIADETLEVYKEIFTKLKKYKNNSFIIYDDYSSYKSLENEPWFRSNVSSNNGIWLGENVTAQYAIKMNELTLNERKIMFNQIGYVVNEGTCDIVRYVVDKEFDDEK